jgi:hypothetical protein
VSFIISNFAANPLGAAPKVAAGRSVLAKSNVSDGKNKEDTDELQMP